MKLVKADPKDSKFQARQKAGKWGHDKRFHWVSRERMEELCTRHPRLIVRRVFFGRRVTVVQDSQCGLRAMIRKARKGSPGAPDLSLPGIEPPARKRR